MSNPFKDQLLKAGLVSKKQAKKIEHENRINRQQNKKNKPSPADNKAQNKQTAQTKRCRELNQQLNEENRQREQNAQIKQLIENNRLTQDNDGDPYNFVERNKIKRIFVSKEMADKLSCGQLAIVKLGNSYEIVPAKVARQIACRNQEAILAFHEGS